MNIGASIDGMNSTNSSDSKLFEPTYEKYEQFG